MIDKDQFMQIVIVAHDAKDMAERYHRLFGIELPKKKRMTSEKGGILYPCYYKGKLRLDIVIETYTFCFKDITFEIIEPVEGKSIWRDYLLANGQGLHNIGFFVDDIKEECKRITDEGGLLINHGYFPDQCYVLMDAEETLGTRFNLKGKYRKNNKQNKNYREFDYLLED